MDIKRTPLALLLTAVISSASHANDNDNDPATFCRNGGQSTDYTCDNDKQRPDREAIDARALPSTDEAWMQGKLAEIKAWLQQEKESPGATTLQQPTAATQSAVPTQNISVRNPAATNPELMRIETLSREGNHRGAMTAINSYMASNQNSLEGLLTKSLVLNNMGQKKEAEALLKNTISRYPSSPEAYNNLAVLYSEQGDYGRAIETLLKAFSTHPTYAQVHQNLRELYSTVASQAYSRALNMDEKQNAPQLVMLRRTSENTAPTVNYQPAAITSSTTVASLTPAKTAAPYIAPEEKRQPQPEAMIPQTSKEAITEITSKPLVVQSGTKVESVSNNVVVVEASTNAEVTAGTSDQPSNMPANTAGIIAAVDLWAAAWSNQDVDGYIKSYVPNYSPDGLSNSAWQEQRNQRLTKPTYIRVTLSNTKAKLLNANTAIVTFVQRYESNTYQDMTNKELTLVRVNNKWKLSSERSL
jgi:tetratricopeptide (TPR) repeat protein